MNDPKKETVRIPGKVQEFYEKLSKRTGDKRATIFKNTILENILTLVVDEDPQIIRDVVESCLTDISIDDQIRKEIKTLPVSSDKFIDLVKTYILER